MSNPPCLNRHIFLIMNTRIENAVEKLGLIDGLLRSLFVAYVPFGPIRPSVFGVRRSVFLNRLTHITQPLAAQPPTQFRTQLNTIEHNIFTHPRYGALRSFTSFWSLRSFLNHRTFQTNLKNKHKKTRKNTRIATETECATPKPKLETGSPFLGIV
jgi:hypothetical protein